MRSTAALAACLAAATAHGQTIGPDPSGYLAEKVPSAFVDIAATGVDLGLSGADDAGATVAIGFPFPFYGQTFPTVQASTNGYLTFDGNPTDAVNECPYFPFAPSVAVYALWDDLSLAAGGAVLHEVRGEAPERVSIFQWQGVQGGAASGSSLTFQVRLHEGSGTIELDYATLDGGTGYAADGSTATIGLENSSFGAGTGGLLLACDQPFLASGDAWRIVRQFPFLRGPDLVLLGDVLSLEGAGTPGDAYCVAYGPEAGPVEFGGPFPLDLGPDLASLVVVGAGVVGPDGAWATAVPVPSDPALACASAAFQAYTLGAGEAAKTNVVAPDVRGPEHVQTVVGTVVQVGTGDHFAFEAAAGARVTLRLCPSSASSPLQPEVCLFGPEFFSAKDTQGGPGCFGDGFPFAALLEDVLLPHDGTYTVIASGSPLGGPTGGYELTVTGCVGPLVPSFDGGPSCP